MISTHFEHRLYPAVDAADQQRCCPDFAIAAYPGHLWTSEDKLELSRDVPVTRQTPPTFLLQPRAENDDVDSVNHSLVYYVVLKNAGVPVEMHLYAQGGHAFGLRRTRLPITDGLSWSRPGSGRSGCSRRRSQPGRGRSWRTRLPSRH